MQDIHVRRDDTVPSLTVEWNNRTIQKDATLTWVLFGFWSVWTACTLAGTWFAHEHLSGPVWFILAIAYLVVLVLPFTWILRYTTERVEFRDQEFRHHYVELPWFNPVRWPLASIASIELGYHVDAIGEPDATVTLSVRSKHKRALVAYWADDSVKHRIYREIDAFLTALDSPIERRDMLPIVEDTTEPQPSSMTTNASFGEAGTTDTVERR